jgi:hypothetical protein
MHSIRLDIEDSVFDKVIYFLKNLPVNEVKIIEDTETSKKTKTQKFNSIRLHTKDFKFDREEANAR